MFVHYSRLVGIRDVFQLLMLCDFIILSLTHVTNKDTIVAWFWHCTCHCAALAWNDLGVR